MGKDFSFYMKIGLRFQNLVITDWSLADHANSYDADFAAKTLVRHYYISGYFSCCENNNALRERGQKRPFGTDRSDSYIAKDVNSFYVDLMFSYQAISVIAEYLDKATSEGISAIIDQEDNQIGNYYKDIAYSIAAGYIFDNNMELALRLTNVEADDALHETNYTIVIDNFFVGYKLEMPMDYSFIDRFEDQNTSLGLTPVDIHF